MWTRDCKCVWKCKLWNGQTTVGGERSYIIKATTTAGPGGANTSVSQWPTMSSKKVSTTQACDCHICEIWTWALPIYNKSVPFCEAVLETGLNERVDQVHVSIWARHLNPINQAHFIYDHLEGEAKNEIRYRPRADKRTQTLQEGCVSRKQLDGESLIEYSNALFCLMQQIVQSKIVTPGGCLLAC